MVRNPSSGPFSASKLYGGGGGSLGFSSEANVCVNPDPLAPGLLSADLYPPLVPSP